MSSLQVYSQKKAARGAETPLAYLCLLLGPAIYQLNTPEYCSRRIVAPLPLNAMLVI
jgi:hypothetical protein